MGHFVETMMYVGETPWHSLGKHAGDKNVTGQDALVLGGIDWKARKAPMYVMLGEDPVTGAPLFKEVEDQYGIVRYREGQPVIEHEPLGNVAVGSKYEILQNSAMAELVDALRTAAGGELRVHTAGSLMGGRKIWILAQHSGEIVVQRRGGREDISAPFLLLHNSHDGSSHTIIQNTPIRVVCWNTLSAALGRHAGQHKIRHTSSAPERMREATAALGYALDYFSAYGDLANQLAATPMTKAEFLAMVVNPLLTNKDNPEEAAEIAAKTLHPENEGRAQTIYMNKVNELLSYFAAGKGNRGQDRYDALNGVTEWIDAQRGRIKEYKKTEAHLLEQRFISAQFGNGAEMKERALKLLTR